MISANFTVSAWTKSLYCCGVPQSVRAPMAAMVFLMSPRSSIVLISLLKASTIGAGAALGRNTPNHDETSHFASSGAASPTGGKLGATALLPGGGAASGGDLASC